MTPSQGVAVTTPKGAVNWDRHLIMEGEMTFNTSLDDTSHVDALAALRGFVPHVQMNTIRSLCRGEEGNFFRGKLIEYAKRIASMVYLHYFSGGADWWITEKDTEAEQHQAFGYADLGLGPGCAELGYISLVELCDIASVELDLHWTPKTLREVKTKKAA